MAQQGRNAGWKSALDPFERKAGNGGKTLAKRVV
jgi:hypothetical protein